LDWGRGEWEWNIRIAASRQAQFGKICRSADRNLPVATHPVML
jgi:hypothetical protein